MTQVRLGLTIVAAALLLGACGDPGDRPQEYQIDQDIYASHGASGPTSTNLGAPGYETWRHRDRDTFGYPNGQ